MKPNHTQVLLHAGTPNIKDLILDMLFHVLQWQTRYTKLHYHTPIRW